MTDPIIDDVFQVYERLEVRHATKVTEGNIVRLAALLKGRVDYSGDAGPTLTVNVGQEYRERTVRLGDWIDNTGARAHLTHSEWKPGGTYVEQEATP